MSKEEKLDSAALYELYRTYARNEKSLLLSDRFGKKSRDEGNENFVKEDEDSRITVRKNPERTAKTTVGSYFEGVENEEDRLIFCDNCNKDVLDFCPTCGMLVMISDVPVPMGVPDRAKKTAPTLFDIRSSPIHGLGVFAKRPLPTGIKFGPYEGIVTRVNTTNGYSWKLRNGKLVDAADETKSNWMRYVNCAPHMSLQNVVGFQYKGGLYYRTVRSIKAGEELLVYYGNSFAKELGIEPKTYFDPTVETVLQDFYCCRYCGIGLCSIKFRDQHELKCKFKAVPQNILEKMYGCKYCTCYVSTEAERDLHQKKCERKRQKTVNDGDEKSERRIRKKTVKKDEANINLFCCNYCHYKTKYKGNLKIHINIHCTTKVFACRFCDKFFKINHNLDRHYVSKHSDRILDDVLTRQPYTCTICGFKTYAIKRHMIKHGDNDGNSHKCHICDKLFKRRHDFKKHLNTHLGIKKYCCVSCKNKFASKQFLDNHILTKHSNKSNLVKTITSKVHSCKYCNYQTCKSTNLNRHIKACESRKNSIH